MKFLNAFLMVAFLFCGVNAQAEETRKLTLIASTPEHNVQKLALVIGNADYEFSPLKNPVNDARAIADALEKLGFEVIKFENLKQKQIGSVMRSFRSKLRPGAVALFFYAGHGLQIKGVNYLPTVDADIVSEDDVPIQSLDVNKVFDVMAEGKTRLNLVFLDACRNNPFVRSFRTLSDGLAKVDAPSGTLISFATRPGSVARDGTGSNGLYTQHLLAAMNESGLTVEQALKRVVRNVKQSSNGMQEPWFEGSIDGEFYFRPLAPGETLANENVELIFWENIKNSNLRADFDTYLIRYPNGKFVAQAKDARDRLIAAAQLDAKQREEEVKKLTLLQQRLDEINAKMELDKLDTKRREQKEWLQREEEMKKLAAEKVRLEEESRKVQDQLQSLLKQDYTEKTRPPKKPSKSVITPAL